MDDNLEGKPKEMLGGALKHWSMVIQTLIPYDKYKQSDLRTRVDDMIRSVSVDHVIVNHPAETHACAPQGNGGGKQAKAWDGVHHLHVGLTTKFAYHLTKNYAYNKLSTYCKQNYPPHRQPNVQTMRHPMGWLKYVSQPPRKIETWTSYWQKLHEKATTETDNIADDRTHGRVEHVQTKESKNALNLQFLIKLIQTYNVKQQGEILTLYNQNKLSKNQSKQLFEIIACANYHTLITKAMALECQRTQTLTFDELMDEYQSSHKSDDHKYETVDTSIQIFRKLCTHNGWQQDEFLEHLSSVLNKKHSKKNTLVLIGQPNSGKSLLIRSLIPITRFYGEIKMGNAYNFVWQDAIDKNVIILEEPCISDDALMEEAKLILEGADTMVHCKNRGDMLLKRTPVLVTTNSSLTKYFPHARTAIEARCHTFKTKTAPFLKHVAKQLNPHMWKRLFTELEQRKQQELSIILDDSFDEQVKTIQTEYTVDDTIVSLEDMDKLSDSSWCVQEDNDCMIVDGLTDDTSANHTPSALLTFPSRTNTPEPTPTETPRRPITAIPGYTQHCLKAPRKVEPLQSEPQRRRVPHISNQQNEPTTNTRKRRMGRGTANGQMDALDSNLSDETPPTPVPTSKRKRASPDQYTSETLSMEVEELSRRGPLPERGHQDTGEEENQGVHGRNGEEKHAVTTAAATTHFQEIPEGLETMLHLFDNHWKYGMWLGSGPAKLKAWTHYSEKEKTFFRKLLAELRQKEEDEFGCSSFVNLSDESTIQEIYRLRCRTCHYNDQIISRGCHSGQVKCCRCHDTVGDHNQEECLEDADSDDCVIDKFGVEHEFVFH